MVPKMISDAEILKTTLGLVSYRHLGRGARKILFFHGFPGSSSQIQIFAKFIETMNLEVLCFDRPGYNRTEIKSTDSLKSSLELANLLTEQFGWKKFEVFSVSGGTPYAICFSQLKASQVLQTHVICGLGALHLLEMQNHFRMSVYLGLKALPWIPGRLLKKALISSQGSKKVLSRSQNPLLNYFLPSSLTDSEFMQIPEVREALELSLREAFYQDGLGPKQDAIVFLSDWGADIRKFQGPIHFWHGEEDQVLPFQMSESMAKFIPHAVYFKIAGEGHITLPVRGLEQVLKYNS